MLITRKNGVFQARANGRFIQHKDFDRVMRSILNELGLLKKQARL